VFALAKKLNDEGKLIRDFKDGLNMFVFKKKDYGKFMARADKIKTKTKETCHIVI
jgi:hypothetical protein